MGEGCYVYWIAELGMGIGLLTTCGGEMASGMVFMSKPTSMSIKSLSLILSFLSDRVPNPSFCHPTVTPAMRKKFSHLHKQKCHNESPPPVNGPLSSLPSTSSFSNGCCIRRTQQNRYANRQKDAASSTGNNRGRLQACDFQAAWRL